MNKISTFFAYSGRENPTSQGSIKKYRRRIPHVPASQVLAACDFFTAEVITPAGLVTYYVLFFIIIGIREIHIAGVTRYPTENWIKQVARNVTMVE